MDNKVKVGLSQIGDSFGNNQYYFPYSVGILQSYATRYLKGSDNYEFMIPIYKRIPVQSAVDYLLNTDIVFFSVYLWNFQLSLGIAKALKRKNLDRVIVFGGPQIPERAEALKDFLNNYPFIDIACFGEGEIPFLTILDNFYERKWEEVPSIGYFDGKGNFICNPSAGRIGDLDKVPSPYLNGVFDKLMDENPEIFWSAMWETNRGCPFSCTFCAWGSKDNKKVYLFSLDKLFKEIDWFSRKKIEFIFCCDANFAMFERDRDIAQKVADNKDRHGYPKVFSVQNTKNSTERIFESQKILNDAGLQRGVNLALQSVNTRTLKSIKRVNIRDGVYRKLQQRFTKAGIPTFTDIILGLPLETYDTLTEGISSLIEDGQHNKMQFINLAVLENTAMAEPEYQKRYGLILQETRLIQHHTSLNKQDEIDEKQMLVVGTETMPKDRWLDSRVFCWMISLLHFNKLLQIPFIVLNKTSSISYRELTEIFLSQLEKYPCISEIHSFFRQKAIAIQNGDSEYIASREWLNMWWPADEYIFIKLFKENKLSSFYEETEKALVDYLIKKNLKYSDEVLHETLTLNQQLLKIPFVNIDLDIVLNYNSYELYKKALVGINIPLKKRTYHYSIERSSQTWFSWDSWLKEVVWYGTKRGAFLYNCIQK